MVTCMFTGYLGGKLLPGASHICERAGSTRLGRLDLTLLNALLTSERPGQRDEMARQEALKVL